MIRKPYLTVEPYTAPTNRNGEPAYTYNGVQVLKSGVDKMSDRELWGRIKSHDIIHRLPPHKNVFLHIAVARMTGEI